MKARVGIAVAMLALAGHATAGKIDLGISDDTVLAQYGSTMSYSGYGHTDWNMGLMYTESDDLMGSIGIEMMGEAGSHAPGLTGGVGIKAYGVSIDNTGDDVGSVTLGGKLRYVPPQVGRLGLSAGLNYGPDVTTFGDANRFMEFNARAGFEVLPEASLYVGYRKVRVRMDRGGDVDLDKGWHLGITMSF